MEGGEETLRARVRETLVSAHKFGFCRILFYLCVMMIGLFNYLFFIRLFFF
nr:MAG TPA: hypothetical protein [Caudoviricetes sp.]DAR28741.1 MAG TPA: hypothetical protein [Herelleviridae sp.]